MKVTTIQKKLGQRIRTLRLDKGINSQIDLALKTGLDRTYVGGIERGERNISLQNIEKIAKALNISLSKLFDF